MEQLGQDGLFMPVLAAWTAISSQSGGLRFSISKQT